MSCSVSKGLDQLGPLDSKGKEPTEIPASFIIAVVITEYVKEQILHSMAMSLE